MTPKPDAVDPVLQGGDSRLRAPKDFLLAHSCGRGVPCPACYLDKLEAELLAVRTRVQQLEEQLAEAVRHADTLAAELAQWVK